MDNKEQIIFNVKREIQLLKLENEYLKEQLQRVTGGLPPLMVDVARSRALSAKSGNGKLPPIPKSQPQSSKNIVKEYIFEIKRLKDENNQLINGKNVFKKQTKSILVENQLISGNSTI